MQTIQHAQDAGADVVRDLCTVRGAVAAQPIQIVALILAETQGPGERRQDLQARLRSPPLLEARVVVGRHGRELRDLFAPQTDGATARPLAEPDVSGGQGLPASEEEVGQRVTIHPRSISRSRNPIQGFPVPGSALSGAIGTVGSG